jgi:FimV-like protein
MIFFNFLLSKKVIIMQKTLWMLCLTLCFGCISWNAVAEKPTSYGPVTKGKTLLEIATALRPDDSIDPYQVAIALMQTNAHAFSNRCNYNTLKLKETLTLPPVEQVKAISVQDAIAEFKRQTTQWKNRKTDKNFTCSSLLEPQVVAKTETLKPPVDTKPTMAQPPVTQPESPVVPVTPPPVTVNPPPQPVADNVKPEPEKSVLPAEFVKLMSIMLGLFGATLLVGFVYDRFIKGD